MPDSVQLLGMRRSRILVPVQPDLACKGVYKLWFLNSL